MEKYIYDTNNGLWYELHGDYYIPFLALNDDDVQPVGKWGRRHLNYIREHWLEKKQQFGGFLNTLVDKNLFFMELLHI